MCEDVGDDDGANNNQIDNGSGDDGDDGGDSDDDEDGDCKRQRPEPSSCLSSN